MKRLITRAAMRNPDWYEPGKRDNSWHLTSATDCNFSVCGAFVHLDGIPPEFVPEGLLCKRCRDAILTANNAR